MRFSSTPPQAYNEQQCGNESYRYLVHKLDLNRDSERETAQHSEQKNTSVRDCLALCVEALFGGENGGCGDGGCIGHCGFERDWDELSRAGDSAMSALLHCLGMNCGRATTGS